MFVFYINFFDLFFCIRISKCVFRRLEFFGDGVRRRGDGVWCEEGLDFYCVGVFIFVM